MGIINDWKELSMGMVLVIASCRRIHKIKKSAIYHAYFNFKGAYRGSKIESICTISQQQHQFKVNKEYVLLVDEVKVADKILYCSIVRFQEVDQIHVVL